MCRGQGYSTVSISAGGSLLPLRLPLPLLKLPSLPPISQTLPVRCPYQGFCSSPAWQILPQIASGPVSTQGHLVRVPFLTTPDKTEHPFPVCPYPAYSPSTKHHLARSCL